MSEKKEVVLSVQDLVVKFNLRGKVLTAIRGISMARRFHRTWS